MYSILYLGPETQAEHCWGLPVVSWDTLLIEDIIWHRFLYTKGYRKNIKLDNTCLEPAGIAVVWGLMLGADPGEVLTLGRVLAQQLAGVGAGDPSNQGVVQTSSVVLQTPVEAVILTSAQGHQPQKAEIKSLHRFNFFTIKKVSYLYSEHCIYIVFKCPQCQ